jgi:hypothetical protein
MSILESTITGFLKNRLVRSCIEIVLDLFLPAGRVTFSFGVSDPTDMVEYVLSERTFLPNSSTLGGSSGSSGSVSVSPRSQPFAHITRTYLPSVAPGVTSSEGSIWTAATAVTSFLSLTVSEVVDPGTHESGTLDARGFLPPPYVRSISDCQLKPW